MNRSSFLGGPTEEVGRYNWPITGLAECQIGFGICESSGLVMQTSVVSQEKMLEYYSQTATYVNPNHAGKPMPGKVFDFFRSRYLMPLKGTSKLPFPEWLKGVCKGLFVKGIKK